MSIARASIDRPLFIWILILGLLFGGIWAFLTLGRLEDPDFTIKQAVVVTQYPGASAEEVAIEVSERLESAIQQMGEVDEINSINQPGLSTIDVIIRDTIGGDELPQIWDKLRARVAEAAPRLPDGAGTPTVNDQFGDVFGVYYALTAPGFTDAEIHQIATYLRREILAVDGVADVSVGGLPEEAIFVDAIPALYATQDISPLAFVDAINNANSVADAGTVKQGGVRARITYPEGSDSVGEIAGLTIGVEGQVLNLADFAQVHRERVETPGLMIRYNGQEAITLGIAGISTENIVDVGNRVDARLDTLMDNLPVGVQLQTIYAQHEVVDESSQAFLINLATSVAIVVVVLALFMGWRAAVVVGGTLLLTVVGTLFFMGIFAIQMERISLGALIIAMGMLVDNAIVVAEGMQKSMAQGKSSRGAADETTQRTQVPLLGATVIGIMAFAGIGLSPDSTGEFLFSLFAVIGISLLLSWILAITVTPLLAHMLFLRGTEDAGDPYGGALFQAYGAILRRALRARWMVVLLLIGITAACYAGFGRVAQQFFPNSNTPLFLVHYKLPQGTDIHSTSEDLAKVENWLLARDEVVSVSAFVGEGADRFLLTYQGERPNPSYGHLIIRTETLEDIPPLRADLDAFGTQSLPGEFRTERMVFGPGGGAPIAARFSGPDPVTLRRLAAQAEAAMREASDNLSHLRNDWREQELALRPLYAEDRAQTAGVTRDDIATTLRVANDGITVGNYREDDRSVPIVIRDKDTPQLSLMDRVVFSDSAGSFVPLQQVIDGFDLVPENTLLMRRDRVPTITVQAGIPADMTAAQVHAEIRDAVEAIELPRGYTFEWGGEYENARNANESLAGQLPVSILIMVLISVLLFNALRQPLIIWLLVPMSVNGVVLGLLGTGLPFTFTALLGLLSLSGMLIKNGIVLVEEIDLVRAEEPDLDRAIESASVSRLRPVMLAAATTILGMAPLLGDAFFVSMAITIMGGLAFASILTLIAAPALYRILFQGDAQGKRSEVPQ
ncbi:efflux RND transporter permease subunit [Roseovarius sp. MMSF_3281]|uniref:efflux RND transporter permease subunit n=1 Tax=Roseovarius sp. MMSF_3281 TaxID=3046694 RepID=UPI00273FE1B0|nr:efflux RND transporter permease subunit [Roseovarius sp. MMSF_3281]